MGILGEERDDENIVSSCADGNVAKEMALCNACKGG